MNNLILKEISNRLSSLPIKIRGSKRHRIRWSGRNTSQPRPNLRENSSSNNNNNNKYDIGSINTPNNNVILSDLSSIPRSFHSEILR